METVALVSFDCYGTLVDWERGMREALDPIVRRHGLPATWEELTGLYIETEMEVEETYRPYCEVLEIALGRTFLEYGIRLDKVERRAFVDSIRRWPPFPETRETLQRLRAAGRRIAILSNVDGDILAESVRAIGVTPDLTVTAEDVGSYKPAPGHWMRLLERGGVPKSGILHAAASLVHDIRPAAALGFRTAWINRSKEPADSARPEFTVSDLRGLPEICG